MCRAMARRPIFNPAQQARVFTYTPALLRDCKTRQAVDGFPRNDSELPLLGQTP